jgi:hypothetical protein
MAKGSALSSLISRFGNIYDIGVATELRLIRKPQSIDGIYSLSSRQARKESNAANIKQPA